MKQWLIQVSQTRQPSPVQNARSCNTFSQIKPDNKETQQEIKKIYKKTQKHCGQKNNFTQLLYLETPYLHTLQDSTKSQKPYYMTANLYETVAQFNIVKQSNPIQCKNA